MSQNKSLKQKVTVVDNSNEGSNNELKDGSNNELKEDSNNELKEGSNNDLEEDSDSNSTVETFRNDEVKINVKDLSNNSFKKAEESEKETSATATAGNLFQHSKKFDISSYLHDDLTPGKRLLKLTFRSVNEIIRSHYSYRENHSSTALDILAIYMKGQKILYTESKTFCEQKLIGLMLPSIFISIACTVLGSALDSFSWGKIFVASLNALNAFLLAVISYLKLDAKAESHRISAYKYDKLQSLCEFSSGKLLFFTLEDEEITRKIDEIESKVKEIKETNQFILPEHIRNNYPLLFSRNVFAEVKKIQYDEMEMINSLKNIINNVINIKSLPSNENNIKKIMVLENDQNERINEIILHRKKFLDLDNDFEKEIKKVRDRYEKRWIKFNCLST
jgi:hypothetical protein